MNSQNAWPATPLSDDFSQLTASYNICSTYIYTQAAIQQRLDKVKLSSLDAKNGVQNL